MDKLSIDEKEELVKCIVATRMQERYSDLDSCITILCTEAFILKNSQFSDLKDVPDEFVPMITQVSVSFYRKATARSIIWRVELRQPIRAALPLVSLSDLRCGKVDLAESPEGFVEHANHLYDQKEVFDEQSRLLRLELKDLMHHIDTVQQLIDLVPEVRDFIPDEWLQSRPSIASGVEAKIARVKEMLWL